MHLSPANLAVVDVTEAVAALVSSVWVVLVATGPWLLMGFFLAGVLHVAMPKDWISKSFGEGRGVFGSVKSVVGAALIGAPLPLCSCSVIPAAAQFRRSGASKGSCAAFAIATPEVDAPAASLTWVMLGWPIAVARVIGAITSSVIAGLVIEADDARRSSRDKTVSLETAEDGCECGCGPNATPDRPSLVSRGVDSVRHAFWTLPKDLAGWMVVGLVLAGVVAVFVPDDAFTGIGDGWPAMLVMLLVGIPLYVCGASSTPLAAALVAKGLDPGAAVVFLLAGPATNPATIAWVLKDLGVRALVAYLGSIAFVTLGVGFAVSFGVRAWPSMAPVVKGIEDGHAGHTHVSVFGVVSGVALAVVLLAPLAVSLVNRVRAFGSGDQSGHTHDACCSHHEPEAPVESMGESVGLSISAPRSE